MGRIKRVLAMLLLPAAACAGDAITWVTFPIEPNYIRAGRLSGQGGADQQIQLFMHDLPQFEQRVVDATLPRLFHDMAQSDGICSLALFKSAEREKIGVFSARPLVHSGYRLFAKASAHEKFEPFLAGDGAIDMDRLVGAHQLRGGFIAGRLLPDKVRELFEAPKVSPAPERTGSNEQALRLLMADRVDYVIAPPLELNYQQKVSFSALTLTSYSIVGVPPTSDTFVVCSNLPVGRRMIEAIDRWQSIQANWDRFTAPYRPWYDEADFRILAGKGAP